MNITCSVSAPVIKRYGNNDYGIGYYITEVMSSGAISYNFSAVKTGMTWDDVVWQLKRMKGETSER